MKKLHVVLMALVAVLAFSAVLSASASAEETLLAEWLIGGAPVTVLTSVTTTGPVTLITLVLGVAAVEILCEGIFDGSIGPNGEDEVTEVLTLGGVAIGSELVGTSLICLTVKETTACGPAGSEADLWVDELPWHTELQLMVTLGTILDIFLNGGYHVQCLFGQKQENLCKGAGASATLTNNTTEGDVLGAFDTAGNVPCTIGEGMQSSIDGEGLTVLLTGTLAVSSE
jgi:hypothetical protein